MPTTASISAVTQDYANILFRTASSTETNTWASLIDSGVFTQAQVASSIAASTEATSVVDPIVRLYQAAFGRAPDKAGLAAWVAYADANGGASNTSWQTTISNLFTTSTEFTTRYGSSTPTGGAFAAALYQNVLNRTPDAAGLTAWTNALNNGTVSVTQALLGFSNSTEFTNNSTSTITTWLSTYGTSNSYVQSIAIGTNAPAVPTTQTFTANADNFTGGAGTNLFFGDETNGTVTVSAADTITGGGGSSTNTFKVYGWKGGMPSMTGIQTVFIGNNNQGTAGTNFTFGSSTGITTLVIDNTGGNANYQYTVPGATTITYQNDAGGKGAGFNVGSSDTSVTVALNGVVTSTKGVVNLYGAALAAATLNVTGASKINLENTSQPSGSWANTASVTAGVLKTLTVTGTGNITLNATDGTAGATGSDQASTILTTIDASGNSGTQTILAPSALTNLKGGSAGGTYDISLATATNVTMTFLSSGTNTVILNDTDVQATKSQGLTNVGTIGAELTGSAGTSFAINLTKIASSTSTLSVVGSLVDGSLNTGSVGGAGVTITFNAGTDTLNLGTSDWSKGSSLVLVANGTGTSDVLNLNVNSATANAALGTAGGPNNALTVTGFETVNLGVNAGAGGSENLFSSLSASPSGGGTEQVNVTLNNSAGTYTLGGAVTLGGIGSKMVVTGSGGLTLGGVFTGGTLDASGLTGALVMSSALATAGTAGTVIKGGTTGSTLVSSIGLDNITANAAKSDKVVLFGDGGSITLSATHTAADTIQFGNGATTQIINTAAATATPGWWGQAAISVTTGSDLGGVTANTGTSTTMETVTNFNASKDILAFSTSAWASGTLAGGGLTLGSASAIAAAQTAAVQTITTAATTIAATTSVILDGVASYSNASNLASALHLASGSLIPVNVGAATGGEFHYLVAYVDTSSNVRVADVAVQVSVGQTLAATSTAHVNVFASDLAQLVGVSSLSSLALANFTFVA